MEHITPKDSFPFFADTRQVTSSPRRNHRHLISSQLSTKQFLTLSQVMLMAMTFRHFKLLVATAARSLFPAISMNCKMSFSSTLVNKRVTTGYVRHRQNPLNKTTAIEMTTKGPPQIFHKSEKILAETAKEYRYTGCSFYRVPAKQASAKNLSPIETYMK
jgi:hypothetical protein